MDLTPPSGWSVLLFQTPTICVKKLATEKWLQLFRSKIWAGQDRAEELLDLLPGSICCFDKDWRARNLKPRLYDMPESPWRLKKDLELPLVFKPDTWRTAGLFGEMPKGHFFWGCWWESWKLKAAGGGSKSKDYVHQINLLYLKIVLDIRDVISESETKTLDVMPLWRLQNHIYAAYYMLYNCISA